jgi:hypothetical protein
MPDRHLQRDRAVAAESENIGLIYMEILEQPAVSSADCSKLNGRSAISAVWPEAAPASACPSQLKSMIAARPAPAMILIILSLGPPSSRGVLSPPLLALFNHFVQIRRWTYLERSTLHSRMLGNELNCVIQISRFKHQNSRS